MKQKLLSLIAALTGSVTMALWPTVDAKADDFIDGIRYSVPSVDPYDGYNNGHVYSETNYSHLKGNVTILSKVRGYEITWIGYEAFRNMKGVVNMTLPKTITQIQQYAFLNATGLQSISLNEGIETLGSGAFYGCTNLISVNIPASLSIITQSAFRQCSSLQSITLPSSIKLIEKDAFSGCNALQSVKGRNPGTRDNYIWVETIDGYAFFNCSNLQYISFSTNLKSIRENAFQYCRKLEDIQLPVNLKLIGEFAFANTGLKTITNYATTPIVIKANVFQGVDLSKCILFVPVGCKEKYKSAEVWKKFGQILEIGEVPIPTGKQKIGSLYYDLQEDLTAKLVNDDSYANLSGELTIPSSVAYGDFTYSVTAMGEKVFQDCSMLTKVVLPNTITKIPNRSFWKCSALTDVTLPVSLETIEWYAFRETGLTSISLPSTVSSIGNDAFSNCTGLVSVNLPASITAVSKGCFSGCSQLTSVTMSSSVTSIGASAFKDCNNLSAIIIPTSVTSIGEEAFSGCTGLTTVKCERTTPVDLSGTNNVFDGVDKTTCILYVPGGSKDAYSNAVVWKDFTDIREKGVDMKIKYGKLYYQLLEDRTAYVTYETSGTGNYSSLSGEITVEEKVYYQGLEYKVIGVEPYALQNCTGITKVNLPEMMDNIYGGAFKNCTNLAEINIPATLTHLDHYAFQNTKLINDNKDEDGAVYYDHCLIYYPLNSREGNYEVKAGTRLLASYVFSGDVKLEGLILPEGLQCICQYALDGMQRLETLSLPSSVYHVAKGFCNNAKNLSTIYNYAEKPLDVSEDEKCFYNVTQNLCTLYVPAGSRTAYQTAEKWKDFPIMEMTAVYTVTFEDYDGREISVQQVPKGADAIKPANPTREGYDFTGWDKEFINVQSDLTVTAQYAHKTYTVLFVDGYTDGVIDTQYVEYGGSATEPEVPEHEGYVFIGWDKSFDTITGTTTVTAQYMEGDGVVTTVFDGATGTLTYYYDTKMVDRYGITEIYNPVANPDAVRFTDYYNKVVKAVIDPSMKDASLTSMNSMFYGGFNMENFNVQGLTKMTAIEGLENLNTALVTNMLSMFAECQSLTSLDLTTFNTAKVTDMGYMFADCSSLTTIYCKDNWNASTVLTSSEKMFLGCSALTGGKGTAFNSSVVDKTYARPDGGEEAPGYFTDFVKGDINGDGTVDVSDYIGIANHILGNTPEGFNEKAADVNEDGNIDVSDYIGVANIILMGSVYGK